MGRLPMGIPVGEDAHHFSVATANRGHYIASALEHALRLRSSLPTSAPCPSSAGVVQAPCAIGSVALTRLWLVPVRSRVSVRVQLRRGRAHQVAELW